MSGKGHDHYFITWAKQIDDNFFELDSACDDYYIMKCKQKLYDLSSTSYNAIFGHSYRPLKNAIIEQLDSFSIATPKAIFSLKEDVSKKLKNFLEFDEGKIFYTVSGAEAIENALKMARQITSKNIILARNDSYHGATLGALSITGDWRNKEHETVDQWTARIPSPQDDPHLIETEKIINKIGADKIAGFCLETITGGNGIIIADQLWWDKISILCKKYKLLLILDEVVCGFKRTIKNFGFHHYQLKPDIICMGKGITAGMIPFGAMYVNEKLSRYYDQNTLAAGLTNYAHPLGLTLLNVILDTLETKEMTDKLKRLEAILVKYKDLFSKLSNVKDVRQIGLLMAIEMNCEILFKDLINANLLISKIGNNFIIAPPYIMSEETLTSLLEKLIILLNTKGQI